MVVVYFSLVYPVPTADHPLAENWCICPNGDLHGLTRSGHVPSAWPYSHVPDGGAQFMLS